MSIADLYESRKNESQWNTSYPLDPNDWAGYRDSAPLPFDQDQQLSFYIHIPFCKQLCSFCEYTRMLCPGENTQKRYLQAIAHDIVEFKKRYDHLTLEGFDIGGGTPTALSDPNFSFLMEIFRNAKEGVNLSDDFEPSIEATFSTLSVAKLKNMAANGLHRLSLGVQSSCHAIMNKHRRNCTGEPQMAEWLAKAWDAGIRKINLDFMYGLEGQDTMTIDKDLETIGRLHPQQVTLYELRTNMIKTKGAYTKEELSAQYTQYYRGLTSMGYKARYGQNTFSKDNIDQGVSSYLRMRMLHGASYKGFGLSAQSMSKYGVSYNIGKLSPQPKQHLNEDSYPEEYTYLLPPRELASKYLAIAAYNGSFNIDRLNAFGIDLKDIKESLDYCLSQRLLYVDNQHQICITPEGFVHYGAVFSLFHSPAKS